MQFHPSGTRIAGRFEVVKGPGEQRSLMGGMGMVYICNDLERGCPVALKTFRPEYLPNRAARERFLHEGTYWVTLGIHPHVVRCYDVVYAGPGIYLVLELVTKEQGRNDASLRSWLTPGVRLPAQQALLFSLEIVWGMQHAVKAIPGFVHRDLKPANVLVGADRLPNVNVNRLRVTDFGLVKVVAKSRAKDSCGDMDRTVSNQLQFTRGAGTALYMAPEQWKGEAVGICTDVYALGCILYEMLTGYPRAQGNDIAAVEQAHCGGQTPPLLAKLPEPLRQVAAHCLALAPDDRYGSWEAVEAAMAATYEAVAGKSTPAPGTAAELSRAEHIAAGWSYSAIGASYLDLGKGEAALQYYERARAVGEAEGERGLVSAALVQLGSAHIAQGCAREAIGCYEQALAIAREIGDLHGEGSAISGLGTAYKNLGHSRQAIGYHERGMAIARETGDRHGERNALGNLGLDYARLGDARHAIGCYEEVLVVSREIGDRAGEGNALGNLGNAYADLGDTRRAVAYYEQQLAITREIGDRRGEGNALGNLGAAYTDQGDPRSAINYCEQHLEIAREIGDLRGEGNALGNLGNAHRNMGDAHCAVGYYEQALALARETGERRLESLTLRNLGDTYLRLRDVPRATSCYQRALAIAHEIRDLRGEISALSRLGNAYKDQGNTRLVIGCYEQVWAIAREIGDRESEENAQSNLGVAYIQLGDAHHAMSCLEQALPIAREIGDRRGEGNTLGNLGIVYGTLGDLHRAIGCFEQQLQIAGELGDRQVEGNALGNLGNAYFLRGDTQRTVEYWQPAAAIFEEIGDLMSILDVSFGLALVLSQQARFREALPYGERVAQISAQIGYTEMAQQAQQMLAQIQTALR